MHWSPEYWVILPTRTDHLIEHGHTYRSGSEELIHVEDLYHRRIALEEIEIIHHSCMNDVIFLNRIQKKRNLTSFCTTANVTDLTKHL